MEDCKNWLRGFLSAGSMECGGVRQAARDAGFTKSELKAARRELDVRTWHQIDTAGEPRVDNFFWYLPDKP